MMEEHDEQQKDAPTATQPEAAVPLSALMEEWRAKAKEEEREGDRAPLLAADEDAAAAKKPTPEERRRAFAETPQRGFQGSLASLLSSLSSSPSAANDGGAKSRRRRRPCLRRWRFSFSRWPLRFLRIQEKATSTTHQQQRHQDQEEAAAARAEQNQSNYSDDEMDHDEDEEEEDEDEGADEERRLRHQQVREDVEREEKRERAVMLANLLVALILVSSFLLVLRISMDGWQHTSSWSSLVSIFAHSSLLWLARWRHDHGRLSAWFVCLFANVILLYRCLVFGVRSEMFAWISMLPIVLFCLLGTRTGVLATIGLLGESLLIYSLTPDDAHNGQAYDLACAQINQQQGIVFVPFTCAPLDRHGAHVGHFITSIEGLLASKLLLIAFMGVFAYVYESNRHSALKRMKVALQQKERVNLSLQQATKAKTAFLANMSHELRTPMHGIIAMAKDLLEMQLSKDAFESARVISDCADHLLGLVNDILDFARIESHQLVLELIPLSVHEEVDKAVSLHAAMAKKKNVDLITDVNIAQPHRIGDPLRFRQILINLLSNAVKFTPSGGRVTVSASSENDSEMVSVKVTDTGIGIPPQGLENIFKSFSQLDASVGRKYGGSGLGLAISKKLCQAMQGDIKVESEVDKGSVFTFTVRLPHPPPGTPLNPSPAHLATEKDNTALVKVLMHGKKVLVVEDNAINQKVATKMLTSLGCSVTIAGDGSAAVTLFEQESFDVILMDVQMPIMDGFQATARIRQIEQHRSQAITKDVSDYFDGDDGQRGEDMLKSKEIGPSEEDDLYSNNDDEEELSEDKAAKTSIAPSRESKRVPIVALTASATTDYEAECLEKGMDRFLTKPFKKEMLQATLLGIFHPLALSSSSAFSSSSSPSSSASSGSLSSASSPAPASPPSSPLP